LQKVVGPILLHYVSNNPVNRIDPDGKDDFEINSRGHVVNRIKNKKADNVHIVDDKGARVEGQSISFKKGTISALRKPSVDVENSKTGKIERQTLTVLEVNGDENATQLFEFLADPNSTNVEWTHAKVGAEGSGRNIIGTDHDVDATSTGSYLRVTGYTLREVNHNHPNKSGPSPADKRNAALYNDKTILRIYHHPNKYINYSQYGVEVLIKPKK
jgi:hypothetical protein